MPLSQKQMEYLALAWQCFETEPKINYEKFHKVAGLASVNSARELMRVTKNKLKAEYGDFGSDGQAAKSNNNTPKKAVNGTPASGKKRGRAAKSASATPVHIHEDADADAEAVEDESPAKKRARNIAKKSNGVKVEETVEDDGQDEIF